MFTKVDQIVRQLISKLTLIFDLVHTFGISFRLVLLLLFATIMLTERLNIINIKKFPIDNILELQQI